MKYLIFDSSAGCWWCKPCGGITGDLSQAGRYGRDQAAGICRTVNAGGEFSRLIPVLETDAELFLPPEPSPKDEGKSSPETAAAEQYAEMLRSVVSLSYRRGHEDGELGAPVEEGAARVVECMLRGLRTACEEAAE